MVNNIPGLFLYLIYSPVHSIMENILFMDHKIT